MSVPALTRPRGRCSRALPKNTQRWGSGGCDSLESAGVWRESKWPRLTRNKTSRGHLRRPEKQHTVVPKLRSHSRDLSELKVYHGKLPVLSQTQRETQAFCNCRSSRRVGPVAPSSLRNGHPPPPTQPGPERPG